MSAKRMKLLRQIEDIEDGDLARRRLVRNGPRVTLKSLEADLAKRTANGRIKPKPATPIYRGSS